VRRLHIVGYVQGVGFRWSMARAAQRFGVAGWVRNRRDASVEALVAGSPEAVAAIIDWARRGPPSAHVERVSIEPGEPSEVSASGEFEQLPTL